MKYSKPISLYICQRHPLKETFVMTPQRSQKNHSVPNEIQSQQNSTSENSRFCFQPYTPNYHKLRKPPKSFSISIGVPKTLNNTQETLKILGADPSFTHHTRVYHRWNPAGAKKKGSNFKTQYTHSTKIRRYCSQGPSNLKHVIGINPDKNSSPNKKFNFKRNN